MKKLIGTAVVITGFGGIIAQIVLLRELMVSFHGNELSIGIILANWLVLEAAGCFFIGRRIEKIRRKLDAFIILQIIFSFFLPVAIYGARVFKQIIGVTPGEGLGVVPILLSSFIILLPVSLPHGILFTFGCKIYSMFSKKGAGSIGSIYAYETLGTIAGGVAFNFLVVWLHSFRMSFLVGMLNLIMCIILMSFCGKERQVRAKKGEKGDRLLFEAGICQPPLKKVACPLFLCLAIYLVFGGFADKIHHFSVKEQWRGQNIVHYENSLYGNVTVAKSYEQYTFYTDGIPAITTPTPDIVFVEEFSHIAMLSHSEPEYVLIISGGAGGLINEVLKHGVKRIDYAELDPLVVKMVRKYSTELTERELRDSRVNIEYLDGRFFLKSTDRKYDVILIGLSEPSDLQLNRLFTKEFFEEASGKLRNGGMLAITLPGSLTYLGDELRDLNSCILATLRSVFRFVRIIPGDFNLFLVSDSPSLIVETDLFIRRFEDRKLDCSLMVPQHISYKLDRARLNWFLSSLEGGSPGINQDFLPLGFFYSLCYWNALFSPYMRSVFKFFESLNLWKFLILFFVAWVFAIPLYKKIANFTYPFAIMSTGFSAMIFQLALIFTFQAVYGYVYHRVAILITTFMAGVAGGSLLVTYFMDKFKKGRVTFFRMETAIILFSIILPLVLIYLRGQAIFLILSFISGFLVGMEFPLANKIYLKTSADLSTSAGFLYGSDLIGGWFGGILAGVAFLPVMGLFGTCLLVTMIKASSAVLVWMGRK